MAPASLSSSSNSIFEIATPVLNAVAYVAMVVTGTLCVFFLAKLLRKRENGALSRRLVWFYLVYVGCMICLGSAYAAALQLNVAQPEYTQRRHHSLENIPKYSTAVFVVGNLSFAISATLADATVAWRCSVIYRESRWQRLVGATCWLLFSASCVIGLTSTVMYSVPSMVSDKTPALLAQIAFASSVTLNVVCTVLIVARLYSVKKYFADASERSQLKYSTISAMFIESCALYATFSVALLVLWFLHSPAAYPIISMLGESQIVSVFLVILRVSRGIAWTGPPKPSVIANLDLANFCKVDLPELGSLASAPK